MISSQDSGFISIGNALELLGDRWTLYQILLTLGEKLLFSLNFWSHLKRLAGSGKGCIPEKGGRFHSGS